METITIRIAPKDQDLFQLIGEVVGEIPSYAKAIAWIEDDETWRPVVLSRSNNYYTKKTWKPIFGRKMRQLSNILREYLHSFIPHYCVWGAYMITKDKKVLICCIYAPQRNIYILYPKAIVNFA